ncbi:Lrp/AsnC family transcriptional regulator [Streptomyces sp. cg40]|uniref:Lrp/AsnC family transcriptional regulator n=1 Tax=Streptomyces sp. cg40 TaxID=3419764 RepID=UPI003D074EE1
MTDPGGRRWVDEDDVVLLDALHVNPRASFEQLGAVLGVSAVTAGRRWRRLTEAGQAWVSSAPGPRMPLAGALFEAECEPGRVAEAAAGLAALPHVFSVHLVSGSRDLYALVAAGDNRTLSRLLLDQLPTVPGLIRVRTSVTTEVFSGQHWRLGAISAAQAGAVRAQEPGDQEQVPDRTLDQFDRELFLALQDDGRAGYRALADQLGKSEQAVKRRISALLRSGAGRSRSHSGCGCRTSSWRASGGTWASGLRPGSAWPWWGRPTCSSPSSSTACTPSTACCAGCAGAGRRSASPSGRSSCGR